MNMAGRNSGVATALVLAMVGAVAHAQSVYKCIGPDGGLTFSQTPCSSDAQESQVSVSSGATRATESPMQFPTLGELVALGPVDGLRRSRPLLQHAQEVAEACEIYTRDHPDLDGPDCRRMQQAHQFVYAYADFGQMLSSGEVAHEPAQRVDIERLGRANRATVEAFNSAVETIRPRLR